MCKVSTGSIEKLLADTPNYAESAQVSTEEFHGWISQGGHTFTLWNATYAHSC